MLEVNRSVDSPRPYCGSEIGRQLGCMFLVIASIISCLFSTDVDEIGRLLSREAQLWQFNHEGRMGEIVLRGLF